MCWIYLNFCLHAQSINQFTKSSESTDTRNKVRTKPLYVEIIIRRIVECEDYQFISPIIKYNMNPYWNCNFSLSAKKQTSMVNFYVYNNNTNGVDQLLAYGYLQFGQLLTKTNAEYKLRLVNSLREIMESYIYFQHYDANPKDEYLPLSNLSCMRLRIISNLQDMELVCHYGEKSFILMRQFSQKTFSYDPKHYKISFSLRGTTQIDKFQLQHELLVRNIGQNSFFRLRFYHPERDIYVYLAAGMIITGLLPENYNILSVKILDLKKSSGKKSNNFKVKIYGPLNQTYINQQKELEIYIENDCNLLVEYFQQGQVTQGRQPYCNFKLPINSFNWKSQNPTLNHSFKFYDSFKSIQTIIILSLTIKRANQLSKTVPKLNPPQNLFDQTSNIFIEQFKLNNCYLYEVLNNTNVQLVHFDKNGIIRTTKKWTIKQGKSEIVIDTALKLPQGGKGVLALQCLDLSFAQKQTNNVEDSTIFKINLQNINQLVSQKVQFCSKFLAFAKKKSLINICKLFNKMVHDSIMTIKLKSRLSGEAKRGLLKIVNIRATGKQADITTTLGIEGVNFSISGLVGNYLLQKPYYFQIGKGNIDLSVEIKNLIAESQSGLKPKKSQSYRFMGKIEQFFGTPSSAKNYLLQTKIAQGIKIQIIYEFIERHLPKIPEVKRQKQYYCYSNCDIILKLSRAQLPNNKNKYKFFVNRSTYTFESFEYRSNNNQICFNEQEIILRSYQKQQDFIFFNCYSHNQKDNLLIYNGSINLRQLFGKGQYEVLLTNQNQGKVQYIYLIFQVLHSYPIVAPSLKLTISKLQLTQTVQSIRSLYKYYLLIRNNKSNPQIIECSLEECSFKVKWFTVLQRNGLLHIDIYSSIKAISKEHFNQSQKELIARGQLSWPQIQDSGCFALKFYPKKQSQLKLTKNQLVLQQETIRLLCSYSVELNKEQRQKQLMSCKKNRLDLDVLNDGLVKLALNQYVELGLKGKVIQIQIAQLGLQISAQSRLALSKLSFVRALNMQLNLNAVITTKESTSYKKITSKVKVKLKGNHFKTHQQFPIKIVFQKYFYLSAQCTVFYNKFTCNTRGEFLFSEFNLQGSKVDRLQVAFCEQQKNIQNKETLLKKQGSQLKKCAIKIQAKDILNLLVLNFEGKGFKFSQFVYFGELNIDKYDEQQLFIKEIKINTTLLILNIRYRYMVQHTQPKIDQILKYTLHGSVREKYLAVNYNGQVTDNNNRPKKTKGFLYKIIIPQCIALQNTTIVLVFQNQQKSHIKPSLINLREFNYYSEKKMKLGELKVIGSQTADKTIECLGESGGVTKFIIDQNPKYVCTLQIKQVNYADIGNQNWTFTFKLHQVLASSKKRLLHLKNTIHDEVLTKKLGIALRHADQCHFIYDIDQFGSTKDSQLNEVQFGYNANSDILQVYLFIDNYFSRKMKDNSERLFKNWIELMPVSHSTINLSNMGDQVLMGTKLQPIANNSIFLQKHINNLMVREDEIFALGELSFQRKHWAYIKLTFKNSTGLVLREDKSKNNAFIHYKFQIENGSKQILKVQTTEARLIESQKDIVFTSNSLDVFLLQQSIEERFILKITGFIIDSSNHYQLFQKRHEISQFLQKRGKFQVNLTIKPPQTNNIVENNFQLSLYINSQSNKEVKFDLINKAKEINKVDALSFRDMSGIQFLDKIVACEQLSHFHECLEQLKESFIYKQDPQTQLFILLTQYFILSFDDHILEQICEITQLTLLKAPSAIVEIQKDKLTSFYYDQLKRICKGEQQRLPKEIPDINSDKLRVCAQQFKKERQVAKLRQLIDVQKYLLFKKDKLFKPISKKHIQLVLAVIDLFLNYSKQFRQMFNRELKQWIQIFAHVQSQEQFQVFVGLVRVCMNKGVSLDKNILIELIQVMVNKQFSLYLVYEFWNLLEIEEKGRIYTNTLAKYQEKFKKNVLEVIRVTKMMFSKIAGSWNEGLKEKRQLHQNTLKIMIDNIQNTDNFQQTITNLELIICFNDYHILSQQQKKSVISLIQKKISSQKNNNSKIILKGLLSKFIKQKEVKIIQKKDSKGLDSFSKQGFHMKYLITRD